MLPDGDKKAHPVLMQTGLSAAAGATGTRQPTMTSPIATMSARCIAPPQLPASSKYPPISTRRVRIRAVRWHYVADESPLGARLARAVNRLPDDHGIVALGQTALVVTAGSGGQ